MSKSVSGRQHVLKGALFATTGSQTHIRHAIPDARHTSLIFPSEASLQATWRTNGKQRRWLRSHYYARPKISLLKSLFRWPDGHELPTETHAPHSEMVQIAGAVTSMPCADGIFGTNVIICSEMASTTCESNTKRHLMPDAILSKMLLPKRKGCRTGNLAGMTFV